MSVAVALTISVYVKAPLFSKLTGSLYLNKQLRKLFFFFKQGFLLSFREEENSMNTEAAGQEGENKRE